MIGGWKNQPVQLQTTFQLFPNLNNTIWPWTNWEPNGVILLMSGLFCNASLPLSNTRWVQLTLSTVLSSAVNKSQLHQEKNAWDCWESNPGLLGEKQGCYLCAMQPSYSWAILTSTSGQGAERIICVSGWSVWDKLRLFRGVDLSIDARTLGELLLARAEQGVEVFVMVW